MLQTREKLEPFFKMLVPPMVPLPVPEWGHPNCLKMARKQPTPNPKFMVYKQTFTSPARGPLAKLAKHFGQVCPLIAHATCHLIEQSVFSPFSSAILRAPC